jgi:hypothetical protein
MENFENYKDLIVSVLFIIIGITTLISAYFNKKKANRLKKNGLTTKGEVVGIGLYSDSDNDDFYYPVVKFKTIDGLFIKDKSKTFFRDRLDIGQIVEIVYDNENPNNFVINGNFEEEQSYAITIVVGIGLLSTGVYK